MKEYRSCHSIEGELFFNHLNKVGYCCMLTPNGGQPVLYENYSGELIDWDDFFNKRDKHIELMKSGSSLPACEGCLWIKSSKWDERKRELKYILINTWVKCNFFCIYCSNHTDENVMNNTKYYNLVPVIKDMIEKKILTKNTKIDIAGGEASLDPHFNELLAVLIDNGVENININTNASVYSENIKRGIEKGFISVISSIDCADAKKFEYIKKKNLYNEVWKNLTLYSLAADSNNSNSVRAKYIIIPGVNDTKKEIRNFILKADKSFIQGVILNIDLHWLRKNFDDKKTMSHIINLSHYFIKTAKIAGIDFQIWAHIEDLIKRYKILCPEKTINIDFIFKKEDRKLSFSETFLMIYYKFIKIFL